MKLISISIRSEKNGNTIPFRYGKPITHFQFKINHQIINVFKLTFNLSINTLF